jgi:large subunit ribosomal protein L10
VFKAEKQEIVEHLKGQLQGSSAVICVNFGGVNVEKTTTFRRQLQELSGTYRVVKNTLAKRAIEGTGYQELDQFLVGPTGLVFCGDEPTAPAKVITKFAEQTEGGFQIKGGMIEGIVFDAQGIETVATIPPRQELLAQLVASLESPLNGLVGTLQGVINEFAYTLQAIAEKQQPSEEQ